MSRLSAWLQGARPPVRASLSGFEPAFSQHNSYRLPVTSTVPLNAALKWRDLIGLLDCSLTVCFCRHCSRRLHCALITLWVGVTFCIAHTPFSVWLWTTSTEQRSSVIYRSWRQSCNLLSYRHTFNDKCDFWTQENVARFQFFGHIRSNVFQWVRYSNY